MAHFRRLVTLAVCWISALAAVPTGYGRGDAPSTVSAVWLRGHAGSGGELFLAHGEGSPLPLVIGRNSRGRAVELLGAPASIRLVRRAAGASASAGTTGGQTPEFVSVAELRMPAGNPKRVLLVLAAAGNGGGALRGTALADDDASFPAHTVRVANFAGASVLMRLNKAVKSVAPGATEPFPYAVLVEPKVRDVPSFPFALAAQDAVFFNGRIDAWPNSRTLILLAPPAGEGRPPSVQVLVDRVKPPAIPAGAKKG